MRPPASFCVDMDTERASPDRPPRTLVIYACDAGYAYPTLISAQSVRRHATVDFDLWIFAADFDAERFDRTSAIAETFGAKVAPLSSDAYMGFDPARFRVLDKFDHLTPSVLARLVTGRRIPAEYDQVLYLDGDTYCTGDLAPLICFRAPKGRLLAAADSVNYIKNDKGPYAAWWRSFFQSLGVPADGRWFNTGVMMAERRTWAERTQAALDYFMAHTDLCRLPVDSSTNVASRDHLSPISCRWNFMAPMRMWGLDEAIAPRLYHFTGRDKPWLGPMAPWKDFWPRYRALHDDPALSPLAIPFARAAQVAASNRHRALGQLKQATIHRDRAAYARHMLLDTEKAVLV
jgi:lipopolysaccharide biosynthesis glycosyltransferase